MTAVLMTPPYVEFMDANGAPLAGGKVYAYSAGTLTPKDTYTDSTGTTPNANPVILDSAGRAEIWINGSYKFIVKDSSDVTIRTVDNVSAFTTSAVTIDSILPAQSGNAGKFLTTNGANASWGASSGITLVTTATTSGTAIDVTGIPSTAKQIIVSLYSVGSGTSGSLALQLGSGAIETTGYNSDYASYTSAPAVSIFSGTTTQFGMKRNNSAVTGMFILNLVDAATNSWACTSIGSSTGSSEMYSGSGTKALSGALDRLRLSIVGGPAFNAGKMSVQYF